MIDILALSVAHALLVLAAIRLMKRDELDREGETRPRFGKRTMTPLTRPDDSQAGPP